MKGFSYTAFSYAVSHVASSISSASVSFLSLPFSLITHFSHHWLTLRELNFASKDFWHCLPLAICSLQKWRRAYSIYTYHRDRWALLTKML